MIKQAVFDDLVLKAGTTGVYQVWFTRPEMEKFANLLLTDILQVVAAHGLSNDTALETFANLKALYENTNQPTLTS